MTTISGNNIISNSTGIILSILEAARTTDHFLFASYITFGVIGIPANLAVICTIIRWRRLHLPRNIMWLGVGISNVIMLTCHLLRVLFVWCEKSWLTHAQCTWFSALLYAYRLLIMLLSSLERYIYLHHSSWYKIRINNRSLLTLQCSCFFLIFLVAAAFSQIPDDADESFQSGFFTFSNFKTIGTILIGLFPICLTGVVMTRFKARQEQPLIEMVNIIGGSRRASDETNGNIEQQNNHFVLIGNRRVSRLEVEAADSANLSLVLFLACIMLPPLVLFCILSFCIKQSDDSEICTPYLWIFFYTSTFLNDFYSGVVNVLFFVVNSHDLKSLFMKNSSIM